MKSWIAPFAFAALAASASAQDPTPVRLAPHADAPRIGTLDTPTAAIPADWPEGAQPQAGWLPIRFRAAVTAYVDNNDMGKDLAPKPGSLYYLSPDKTSAPLAVAAKSDTTQIIAVDPWWCELRLEKELTGYIPKRTMAAATPTAAPSAPASDAAASATKRLRGTLQTTSLMVRTRTGLDYRLVAPDGKPIALIDVSELPERVQARDFVDATVEVSGPLAPNERGDLVILLAQSLKKAN